jgi:uncharacterized protein
LIASIVKLLVAAAVALPLVLYFLQDRLIFHPQRLDDARRASIAARFTAAKDVFIASPDGTRLHAWHVAADPGAPLLLYFGGNAEEVSGMLEAVGDPRHNSTPGVAWLLTDYRGYGASGGKPSAKALIEDAKAWYDYAARMTGTDAARIFVFGRSLGSGVAVPLAAERRLAGVILVAPYDSLAAVAAHYYPYLPVKWMLRHSFDSIALAPRLEAPLFCVIAGGDEVIPPAHAERLFQAWSGPKRKLVLAGAPHNGTDSAPEFWPAIRRFVSG